MRRMTMTRTQAVRLVASTLAFTDPPLITGRGVLDRCKAGAGVIVDALTSAGVMEVDDDRVTDVALTNGDGTAVFAGE